MGGMRRVERNLRNRGCSREVGAPGLWAFEVGIGRRF